MEMNNTSIMTNDWMPPNNHTSGSGSDDKIFYNYLNSQSMTETGLNFANDTSGNNFGGESLKGIIILPIQSIIISLLFGRIKFAIIFF